jgi:hypothetical protein
MIMKHMLSMSAAAVAMLGSAAAQTPPPAPLSTKPAPSCFQMPQFQNWKAADDKTLYIRVNMNQYYRLDLSASCSTLTWPGSHLITQTRGSTSVCSPVDWDLAVSQGPPGGIPQHCIVKAMTPLSPADVAAIPKKFKP